MSGYSMESGGADGRIGGGQQHHDTTILIEGSRPNHRRPWILAARLVVRGSSRPSLSFGQLDLHERDTPRTSGHTVTVAVSRRCPIPLSLSVMLPLVPRGLRQPAGDS